MTHGAARAKSGAAASRGCWLPTGFADVTPSIQASKAGVLFVARSKDAVLRSTDQGRTWTNIPVPALANGDGQGGGHGYVHIDPRTDRLYYVTSMSAPSCGARRGSVLQWSDDQGASWRGVTVACDTYDWGKVVTGPAPRGAAYPSAIYFMGVGHRFVGGERFVYRSLDGGATWKRMDQIASATTEAGVGVAARDGTVYFDYPEFTGFDATRMTNKTYPWKSENQCRQMVAVSEDYGVTWSQRPVTGSQACGQLFGQQRVAVDAHDTLYVIWVGDKDTQLYLSTSRDHARTWSAPVNVTAPGMTFSLAHANIVAGEPGHVVIASMQIDTPKRPESPPKYPGLYGGAGYDSYAVLTESRNATAAHPRFTSVNLDAGGDPTVANGQSATEGTGYLAMDRSGQGWAVYVRHAASTNKPGDVAVARFFAGAAP